MPLWALALRLTGVGWYVAACIIVGLGGGILLDRWLQTQVLFTLLGVVLGSATAFYGVYRMVRPLMGETEPPPSSSKGENGQR